jgi:hypothetical protein
MAYSSAATSTRGDIDQLETFLARGTGEPLIERYNPMIWRMKVFKLSRSVH